MGQFSFMYRQYVLNQLGINPGYTGSREVFVLASQYRDQWAGDGFEGSPKTFTISADAPLKGKNVALGFHGVNESIGNTNNYNFNLNYAYRINFPKGKLSLGIKASANVFTIKNQLKLSEQNDVAFYNEAHTYFLPNAGFGAYYYDYNKYFLGFSIPNLLVYETKTGTDNSNPYTFGIDDQFIKGYNFIGSGGYLFDINEDFSFRLSTFLQYNITTGASSDINAMALIKNIVWVGGSYHYNTTKILTFMTQWQINPQIKLGYAFDTRSSDKLLHELGSSHEVLLRYEFSYIIKAVSPIF